MKLKEAIDEGILSLNEEVFYEDDTIDDYKAIINKQEQEIEKLTKKLDKEKSKNKKAFKIIDNAMTEQMITGEATLNLIELYTILKGCDKKW